jgi:hypothetical protein
MTELRRNIQSAVIGNFAMVWYCLLILISSGFYYICLFYLNLDYSGFTLSIGSAALDRDYGGFASFFDKRNIAKSLINPSAFNILRQRAWWSIPASAFIIPCDYFGFLAFLFHLGIMFYLMNYNPENLHKVDKDVLRIDTSTRRRISAMMSPGDICKSPNAYSQAAGNLVRRGPSLTESEIVDNVDLQAVIPKAGSDGRFESIDRTEFDGLRHAMIFFMIFCMGLLTTAFRVLLGFAFFRGTGYALPSLFFHDGFYEGSFGLNDFVFPFLFLYVVIQYNDTKSRASYLMRPTGTLLLEVMTILLSFSTMHFSFISALITCVLLTGIPLILSYFGISRPYNTFKNLLKMKESSKFDRRSPSENHIFALQPSMVFIAFLFVWLSCIYTSFYLTKLLLFSEQSQSLDLLRVVHPENPILMAFVIVTAPRPRRWNTLSETFTSYYDVLNTSVSSHLFNRTELVVYTEFDDHPVFDRELAAASLLNQANFLPRFVRKGEELPLVNTFENQAGLEQMAIEFVPVEKNENHKKQRLHFSNAIEWALNNIDSTFVMLIEDDFPLCQPDGFTNFLKTLSWTFGSDSNPCAVFIGTGGSGILLRRDIAEIIISLLRSDNLTHRPTDLIMQDCVRGILPGCFSCSHPKQGLVVSRRMLMRHIGSNASTFKRRHYHGDQYQCDWRQPLNGKVGVYAGPV